jgi:thioredoxin reductase (NADPH)
MVLKFSFMAEKTAISEAKRIKTQTELILRKKDSDVIDVIVVGAGTAGMTAAMYLARGGYQVLILEQRFCGGQMLDTEQIDNIPGFEEGLTGVDFSASLENHIRKLGVHIEFGRVNQIQPGNPYHTIVTENAKILRCRALVIASGSDPKSLGVPGEKEFIGRGISYSALVDGVFYKDKRVAVIGGGDSAIRDALFLARYAKQVTILHRRDHLVAERILVNKAFQDPKIQFAWNTIVNTIGGEGRVTNLKVTNLKTNEDSTIYIDGVFIYVGHQPNTGFCKEVIKTDECGYIVVNQHMETFINGIFACGDVCFSEVRQVLVVMSQGVTVAHYLDRYLGG